MKTKIVLSLAMAGLAFAAATNSARAGVSFDISIGSHFPRYLPPVGVAQPPVFYPAPVDNCSPGVAAYPGAVAVAPPPPQVIISNPADRGDGNYGYGYRLQDYRLDRRVSAREA